MAVKRHRLVRIVFMPITLLHLVFRGLLMVVFALVAGLWEAVQEEWFGKKSQPPESDAVGSDGHWPMDRPIRIGASILTALTCILLSAEIGIQLTRLAMRADNARIRLKAVSCARLGVRCPVRIGRPYDLFDDLVSRAATDKNAQVRSKALDVLTRGGRTYMNLVPAFSEYLTHPDAEVQTVVVDTMIRLGHESGDVDGPLVLMARAFTEEGTTSVTVPALCHLASMLSEDSIYGMLTDSTETMYRCGLRLIAENCTEQVASAALTAVAFYRLPAGKRRSSDFEIDARRVLITAELARAQTQEARDASERLCWEDAERVNTFASCQAYLDAYPKGRYAEAAQRRQATFLQDEAAFVAVCQEGTVDAFEAFLREYPGHVREAEARRRLASLQGRDIVDLLDQHVIEVQPAGSGIRSVAVKMRRLVPHDVTVILPVATFLVSEDPSAQNMVTTSQMRETLRTDDWVTISVPAACANRPRRIPNSKDSFTVHRSPHSEELAALMLVLQKAHAAYGVRQAAVWIVTDNATYDNLSRLVSRAPWMATGGSRVIKEHEAARAMQICEEAGIDVTQKAIWQDRLTIMDGLEDADLKAWLQKKHSKQ